ncbi:MAG: pilus assembly protein PilM [Bdellovibrionales bacterium]|nr:pilus assembly protein PilM [Bdellovibrionales bacterium]
MPKRAHSWGIEVSNSELRALRLERTGDTVQISDFTIVPFLDPLPSLHEDQRTAAIRGGLEAFKEAHRRSLKGAQIVIGVPGHESFLRFAKLPPVEPKKIDFIVRFEAVQQLPFPLESVDWGYQLFKNAENPHDISVMIAAITKARRLVVTEAFKQSKLTPSTLTPIPVALLGAMSHIRQKLSHEVWLLMGDVSTDLVLTNGEEAWVRTFPIGENSFNEEAKYPTTPEDVAIEIERSLGYYSSLYPDFHATAAAGFGGKFNDPSFRETVSRKLDLTVEGSAEFTPEVSLDCESGLLMRHGDKMVVGYGLALQGVGLSRFSVNLMPKKTGLAALFDRG